MCTLIVLHRCVEAASLVVAANRDEFFERPAEGPALRETARGKVVAPRDARAGGTWLGLNQDGLFAAITNRRCEAPDPDRRSRGLIVMDALGARSAAAAADEIEKLETDAYNPFNLLVADGRSAHVVTYMGRPERIDLAPGPHVIGNAHPHDDEFPKVSRQREQLLEVVEDAAGTAPIDALADLCRSHDTRDPMTDTCVHADPYGTRSSTLLRLGDEALLRYADGPPCRSEYRDYTHLLVELDPGSPRPAAHPSMRKVS